MDYHFGYPTVENRGASAGGCAMLNRTDIQPNDSTCCGIFWGVSTFMEPDATSPIQTFKGSPHYFFELS